MIDKKNIRWVILILAAILLFSMKSTSTIPKDAVADIEGQYCEADEDCPCLGRYNETQYGSDLTEEEATAWGIGVGSCENNACDMTWCADLEPVGDYIRDNPWAWVKDNIVIAIAIVGLVLLGLFMPKN